MFIRLFIKTIDKSKANKVVADVLQYINKDHIKSSAIKIKPYWKIDDIMVAEIKLELHEALSDYDKENLLSSISNKWCKFSNGQEVLSSSKMEDCQLNSDLELVNIFFD